MMQRSKAMYEDVFQFQAMIHEYVKFTASNGLGISTSIWHLPPDYVWHSFLEKRTLVLGDASREYNT